MRILLYISLIFLPVSLPAKVYHLYFLGGQSNMNGYGYTRDLPAELREAMPEVMMFHGNPAPDGEAVDGRGLWAPLRPGFGVQFSSDGQTNRYSNRFGLELSFAHELRRLRPDAPIALIKYARGGTSIDTQAAAQFGCWDPDYADKNGVNQYDHFLATLRNALQVRDIDGDGEDDQLLPMGILWMQGESDAHQRAIALRYEAHLRRLMNLIRASLRTDDLPVVIGRISDSGRDEDGKVWDQLELVQAAQQRFVETDPAAALVSSTDQYGYSDKWHYDSAGYLDLGRQFARKLVALLPEE